VLGFLDGFVALGASATAIGQLLLAIVRGEPVAGAVIILFGLFGDRPCQVVLVAERHPVSTSKSAGANTVFRPNVLGLAFRARLDTCIGPVGTF